MQENDQEDEVIDLQKEFTNRVTGQKKIARSVTISMLNKSPDV